MIPDYYEELDKIVVPALKDHIIKLNTSIVELEIKLGYANDTLAKCDLARQNAGGMEMRIQELERENVELEADRHGVGLIEILRERNQFQHERDQLRLQVAWLREALKEIATVYVSPNPPFDRVQRAVDALAEIPTQCASEVLGPTINLLKEFIWLEDRPKLSEKLKQELTRLENLYK